MGSTFLSRTRLAAFVIVPVVGAALVPLVAGAPPAGAAACAQVVTVTGQPGLRARSAETDPVTAHVTSRGVPDLTANVTFKVGPSDDITFGKSRTTTATVATTNPGPGGQPGDYVVSVNAGTRLGAETVTATTAGGCAASFTLADFGPAVLQAVTLVPAAVPVGKIPPSSTTIFTAITDAGGNLVTDATVTYATTGDMDTFANGAPTGMGTLRSDGRYSSPYSVSGQATPRQATILSRAAFPAGVTDAPKPNPASAVLAEYGPPAAVATPTVSPSSVPADGLVPVTLTTRVTDGAATPNPVPGASVTFSSAPTRTISPNPAVTDANGRATAHLSAPTTTGTVSVSAAVGSVHSGAATLTVTPAPATIKLTLSPASIAPDGTSTTTATAAVADAAGRPVSDAVVTLSRSTAPGAPIPTANQGDGTYRAVLRAVSTAQTETISARTENGQVGAATLVETAHPGIGLQLTPGQLPADGHSTAVLSVTFVDVSGVAQPNKTISLGSTGDAVVSPGTVVTGPDGSATAQVRAGRQVGTQQLTASSGLATSSIPLVQQAPAGSGYFLVARDGGIFSFGALPFEGSTGNIRLNQPIVGMAATPDGGGYWLVAADGGIFNFGDAKFFGSTGGLRLNRPIVGMAATPSGGGYWLVASDGGIFNFGDAVFRGSTGAIALNKPIVGMAAAPSGGGYWLVASDGGIFNFGDAVFRGSTGAIALNKPIVGMAATASGGGYWLVASDGGIFNFGDALFAGSAGAIPLHRPIVGMGATADGGGYWLVASDGGIFNYGDAQFRGSTGAITLNQPIVGMAGV